jgi:hypothetical protein
MVKGGLLDIIVVAWSTFIHGKAECENRQSSSELHDNMGRADCSSKPVNVDSEPKGMLFVTSHAFPELRYENCNDDPSERRDTQLQSQARDVHVPRFARLTFATAGL